MKKCSKCKTIKLEDSFYKNSKDLLHLHHPDYKEPLDIITLCIDCHGLEHRRNILQ